METDKVLALAKEAGGQRKRYMLSGNVVVTFLEDDFIKFAALIQREMEAENAELRSALEKYAPDILDEIDEARSANDKG